MLKHWPCPWIYHSLETITKWAFDKFIKHWKKTNLFVAKKLFHKNKELGKRFVLERIVFFIIFLAWNFILWYLNQSDILLDTYRINIKATSELLIFSLEVNIHLSFHDIDQFMNTLNDSKNSYINFRIRIEVIDMHQFCSIALLSHRNLEHKSP